MSALILFRGCMVYFTSPLLWAFELFLIFCYYKSLCICYFKHVLDSFPRNRRWRVVCKRHIRGVLKSYTCKGVRKVQADLILLHFADIMLFTNWRSMATLHRASLSVPFSNSIYSLQVSVLHSGNSHNISNFFIIIIFVMAICDL